MKVETVSISKIKPYERNPRRNDAAVDAVAASIQEFGFQQPIVCDMDGVIIVGHTRLKAAKKLGLKTVPVVYADLPEDKAKAYRLADNKTGEFAEWDFDLLDLELGDIELDMEPFGFERKNKVVEDNYNPEPPEEPKAKRGDIYQLGRHRLMCGDSTSAVDVQMLVGGGGQMDLLLTDPPYNVDINEKAGKIMNDNMDSDSFRQLLTKAFSAARDAMKPGATFHVWYGESSAYNFRGACADAGLNVRQQLIWVKNQATIGRQDFQHQYESVLTGDFIFNDEEITEQGFQPCLYGWKDGAGHSWYKKRKERDVLFFDKPKSSAEHPTMKPVLLFDYEMQCNTKQGDAVLDLFGGSGTTLIAAEQNGRLAYLMELDPKYVDVIIDRWEKFTGKKAVLLNEGH